MPEILGKTLKKAREAKQLSVDEISERTRIPRKIISAIEEDRLGEISSVFYARGFVRSYSKFLGCGDEKAVREYLTGSEKKREEPRLLLENERVPGDWFIKYRKNIAVVVFVIFGIWMLGLGLVRVKKFAGNVSVKYRAYLAKKKEDAAGKALKVKPVTPPEEKKGKGEKKAGSASMAEAKKTAGVELEITALDNTWIQVKSSGELLFKGIFKKGSMDTWHAKKEITLELGNAGDVRLKVNGRDVGSPGKRGEKKTIVITSEGILK